MWSVRRIIYIGLIWSISGCYFFDRNQVLIKDLEFLHETQLIFTQSGWDFKNELKIARLEKKDNVIEELKKEKVCEKFTKKSKINVLVDLEKLRSAYGFGERYFTNNFVSAYSGMKNITLSSKNFCVYRFRPDNNAWQGIIVIDDMYIREYTEMDGALTEDFTYVKLVIDD